MMEASITDVKLRLLASNLGEKWKAVATYLGFRKDEIYRIQADYQGTEEQIFHMLMSWWQRWDHRYDGGDHVAVDTLCKSLIRSGRTDLAESWRGRTICKL